MAKRQHFRSHASHGLWSSNNVFLYCGVGYAVHCCTPVHTARTAIWEDNERLLSCDTVQSGRRIPKLTVSTPTGRRRQRVPVTRWFTAQQTTMWSDHIPSAAQTLQFCPASCYFLPCTPPTLPQAPYRNNVYWTTTYINNCMQHNSSWEVDGSPASQEIHRILRKPKVHYRLLQIPLRAAHLSQISPGPKPICLRTTIILSSHLRIGLQSGLFPPVFLNKTL